MLSFELFFSNSVISHEVRKRKRFYFSVYSLVFVLIEQINQTLEAMFHRLSKYLESRQKYSVVFSTLFSVFEYPDETLFFVFDTFWKNNGRRTILHLWEQRGTYH